MIKAIYEAGISEIVYWLFISIGFIISMAYCVILCKKQKNSLKKSFFCFWFLYIFFAIILLAILPLIEINVRYKSRIATKVFVYMPLGCFLASKIFKIKWQTLCDITSLGMCLLRMISHIGCIFEGCCKGIISDFGIYNPLFERTLFPVQILDIFIMSTIFIILAIVYKNKKYNANGILYPTMLITYGSCSFAIDFLRNNNKVWLGFSSIAYHGLFMAIIGIILLIAILIYNKHHKKMNNSKEKEVQN